MPLSKPYLPVEIDYENWEDLADNYAGKAATLIVDVNGKGDPEARVGRGKRGFILGYRVHTACCAESEMPLTFTVAPCNENDKVYFKPLLERVHALPFGPMQSSTMA